VVGRTADHDAVDAAAATICLVLQRHRGRVAALHSTVQAEVKVWEVPLQRKDPLIPGARGEMPS
jgi:hypothetical protein